MATVSGWKVEPLGDRAALATCRDEATAQQLAAAVRQQSWDGVQDIVVAYHSVAVHVDSSTLRVSELLPRLGSLKVKKVDVTGKLHTIPCCYELGEDLEMVARQLNLSTDEVIALHLETTFTVYAIGFSPGFPYLGWLPKELQGIARRQEPRLRVPPGSIGIVGKQSCIYPHPTPGGWALIGRTPMKVVDIPSGTFLLAVGDQVKFERVEKWDGA